MRRHLPGRQAAALPSLVCAVGWACRQQSSGNFHPVVFHPVIQHIFRQCHTHAALFKHHIHPTSTPPINSIASFVFNAFTL